MYHFKLCSINKKQCKEAKPYINRELLLMNKVLYNSLSIIFFVFMAFPASASATLIEFECTYDYIRDTEFNAFVAKVEKEEPDDGTFRPTNPLKFWVSDKKIYFSIDTEKKLLISGRYNYGLPTHSVAVYPDAVAIDISTEDAAKQKLVPSANYSINRITGEFYGNFYAAGHPLYQRYFKNGDRMWGMHGKCSSVNRLF
jgi:hypothetical protein